MNTRTDFTATQEQADTLNAHITEENTMNTTTSTKVYTTPRATLIALYKRTGGHFFDAANMRFFSSRIAERAYQVGHHNHTEPQFVFVTSEKYEDLHDQANDGPRLYSVRHWDGRTSSIDTVGEFQQYKTREAAAKAAKAHAEHLANQ